MTIAGLLLAGCGSAQVPGAPTPAAPVVTALVAATLPATAPGVTPTVVPAVTGAPASATLAPALRQQHALSVTLDYAAHAAWVQQLLTYPNTTGEALPEIVLEMDADRHASLTALRVDGAAVTPQREGARWSVRLPQPLAPGALARIETDYTLALPALPPGAADAAGSLGWTALQTNLAGWYPVVPPRRSGEWLVHRPFGSGENQALEAADYAIDLKVRGGADLIVAASAAGEPQAIDGGTRWRYSVSELRSFALSVSDAFTVRQAMAGAVRVRAYMFAGDVTAGEAALQAVVQAVEAYERAYGPYPYPQLSMVEGDFGDGLEAAGLFFVGRSYYGEYDGTPRNWLTAISVHEAAHQWWYGLVGDDQALEPWLDESFATYSELVFYQTAHPDLERWWWQFRVRSYQPGGAVNSSIYDLPQFRPYVNAVYLRGALFLDELRKNMGDEAFFDFLHRYVARYSGRIVTAADFWSTLGPQPDLARLREAYFRP